MLKLIDQELSKFFLFGHVVMLVPNGCLPIFTVLKPVIHPIELINTDDNRIVTRCNGIQVGSHLLDLLVSLHEVKVIHQKKANENSEARDDKTCDLLSIQVSLGSDASNLHK